MAVSIFKIGNSSSSFKNWNKLFIIKPDPDPISTIIYCFNILKNFLSWLKTYIKKYESLLGL